MPDLDGFEATQIIRYELEEPISSVPIVALTGFSSSDEARKYYEAVVHELPKRRQSSCVHSHWCSIIVMPTSFLVFPSGNG